MSRPVRIQRQRTKGWRMPEGAVYVGRPGRWGNPFEADHFTPDLAVDAFKVHLAAYFGWESRTVARAFYPWPVASTALRDWLAPLRRPRPRLLVPARPAVSRRRVTRTGERMTRFLIDGIVSAVLAFTWIALERASR